MAEIRPNLSMEEYLTLFEFAERTRGTGTIREAQQVLKDQGHVRNRTTVARVLKTIYLLRDRADPCKPLDQEEAESIRRNVAYNSSVDNVNTIFRGFRDWLREKSEAAEYANDEHRSLLKAEVENLRSCLVDPRRLPRIPDERELLMIKGHDWRLDPVMWFYLCTPDFTDPERWGDSFPMLRQHMKESPFWDDYDKLWESVLRLESDYRYAAAKLRGEHEEFGEEWIRINTHKEKRNRGTIPRPSRYPGISEEDLAQFEPSYTHDYCERIIARLIHTELLLDVHERLLALEDCLVQLNKDLVSHVINPIIDRGSCGHPSCRQKQPRSESA